MGFWRDEAACRFIENELFFDPKNEAAAIRICGYCSVRSECLQEALLGSDQGVFGGTTARERAQMKEDLLPIPVVEWEVTPG